MINPVRHDHYLGCVPPITKIVWYFSTFLQLLYSVECDEHFYGMCNKHCKPDPDRYTCNMTGSRICKRGRNVFKLQYTLILSIHLIAWLFQLVVTVQMVRINSCLKDLPICALGAMALLVKNVFPY